MNEEKLYLHKLINQRKRFEKWDIADEYKQEYLELIDRQIAIEKEKSKKRKEDYSVFMWSVLIVAKGSREDIFIYIIEVVLKIAMNEHPNQL